MSKAGYEHLGDPDIKVMEECGELVQAICKARRFGWDNYHPEDTPDHTNAVAVCEEMEDVLTRCRELRAKLLDGRLIGSLVAPFRSAKEEPRVITLEPGEGVTVKGEFSTVIVERATARRENDAVTVAPDDGCQAQGRGSYGNRYVVVVEKKEAQDGASAVAGDTHDAGGAGGVPPVSAGS